MLLFSEQKFLKYEVPKYVIGSDHRTPSIYDRKIGSLYNVVKFELGITAQIFSKIEHSH
jgi:hypothetical protein